MITFAKEKKAVREETGVGVDNGALGQPDKTHMCAFIQKILS